jgi:hypothetical protein
LDPWAAAHPVGATLAMIVATLIIPQRVKCPLFTAVTQTAHAVPDARGEFSAGRRQQRREHPWRRPPIDPIALVLRYSRMNNPGSHEHWFAVPARENGAIYGQSDDQHVGGAIQMRIAGGLQQLPRGITRLRIPNGIWQTDVFSPTRCLIRLPFEGLALAA